LRLSLYLQTMNRTFITYLILTLLIILGTLFRFINLAPFKFYPDSYQNLIVAKNIQDYGSVLGTLGDKGMIYPPYFMWSRPAYPLLINLVNLQFDIVLSAQIVSFLLGIFSILLCFFAVKKIFKDYKIGLFSSGLLSISFNHTVWGGFIYTETTGLFFIFLVILILFANLEEKSELLNLKDLLLGGVFTLAVFSRYEYILLVLPITYLISTSPENAKIKLINFYVSFSIFSAMFLFALYPVYETLMVFFLQNQRLLLVAGAVSIFIILGFFIFKGLLKKSSNLNIAGKLISNIILQCFLVLLLYTLFPNFFPLSEKITGLRNFFKTDPLILSSFFAGLYFMYRNSKHIKVANFVLITTIVMIPIYYQINPTMQRYWTHLIPFFLIPAGYGLFVILSRAKNLKIKRGLMNLEISHFVRNGKLKWISLLIITILFAYQIYLTFNGIRFWHEGSWTRESYEEKSAKMLQAKILKTGDSSIIASFPEPYYIFTNHVTHSLNDNPPYIYIDESLDSKEVYIVQDMGMTDIFPNFSKFLDKNLKEYKVDEYWVGEIYHYRTRSEKETGPVSIYKLPLKDLKSIIKSSGN
jgi:hypothetical protein